MSSDIFSFHFSHSIKVDIGDLQAEEKRDVVLQLTLDAVPQPYTTTPQQILTAQVDYFNVLTNQLGNEEAALTVFRPGWCIRYMDPWPSG